MNTYIPTRLIKLTRGFCCMVSDVDFEWLNSRKWHIHSAKKKPYAHASNGYRNQALLMHRVIWEKHNGVIPPRMDIHHRNSNGLDNRIENLQLVTRSQHVFLNNYSKMIKIHNFPVGVAKTRNSKSNPYRAYIKLGGKLKHLGVFKTVSAASNAYKAAHDKIRDELFRQNEI